MHKCFKCGTEFEGNFCPNCGLKWEEEKVCPKCGAKLPSAVKFCTQCGHSFFGGEPVSYSRPRTESGGAALQKWFYALRFFPFAALALFSVLLFAFFAAPVAEMVMGAGLPNVSIGNAYSLHGGLSEVPGIGDATTALIVFAVICIVFSCAFGVFMFVPKLKYKSSEFLNNAMLPELFGYASFVFYPIFMMIGIFIMVKISYADEGMGLLVSGACPVLLIAFSIVFALVAAGSFIARLLLANGHPVLLKREKQMEDRYFQAEKERKAQYYATHTAPVPHPVIGDKKANKQVAIVYKHEKRRYDKAKEGKTPNAVIWMDLNKLPLLIGAAVLSVAIILISILVPILTNKFRVSVLEKIDLGSTQEQVAEILGDPDENSSSDIRWRYYSKEYTSILDQMNKVIGEEEKAFEKGDENALLRLANEEARLNEQLENVKYDYIEIEFTGGKKDGFTVSSVLFEKNRCDSNTETAKTVKNYSVLTETLSQNNKLPYRTYFTDGSYYTSYAQSVAKDISGNSVGLIWSDKFYSEYETYINFSGYLIIDGVCYINSNDVKIPSKDENKISSLRIIDGVTSIGVYAFSGCTNLTSITIPDSVTSIGSYAFSGCTNLTSITIPDSVTSIGSDAFKGCTNIKTATMPTIAILSIPQNKLQTVILTSGDTIGDRAFKGCTSLTSITIPDSITSIGEDAFDHCTSLISITIPNRVTFIGYEAFYECKSLENVTIGNGVTSIGTRAFYECKSLENVTIGNGVTSIGAGAFDVCTSLTSITIPDSVTSIGYETFRGCTRLENVIFDNPNGWYCASSPSATSGTNISSEDLQSPQTAAKYLKATYYDYYWKRKTT